MPDGWMISFVDRGRRRGFLVGISDVLGARLGVLQIAPDAANIRLDPLPHRLDKYGLVKGQILETTGTGPH